jgi:hypothetical protein
VAGAPHHGEPCAGAADERLTQKILLASRSFVIVSGVTGPAFASTTFTDNSREREDIAASLKGDGEAYRRLVVQYQGLIAGQMQRFSRDPVVLEELVQEVFVEAYLSLKSFRGSAPFLHRLRTLATRTGYRHWKRPARRRERETELPENLPEIPTEPGALTCFEAEDLLFHPCLCGNSNSSTYAAAGSFCRSVECNFHVFCRVTGERGN